MRLQRPGGARRHRADQPDPLRGRGLPNYQKLLGHGDAESVGDILAAGSDAAVEKRLRSFADAGVTDLSVRVVPIGAGRDKLIASSRRTRALLEELVGRL